MRQNNTSGSRAIALKNFHEKVCQPTTVSPALNLLETCLNRSSLTGYEYAASCINVIMYEELVGKEYIMCQDLMRHFLTVP